MLYNSRAKLCWMSEINIGLILSGPLFLFNFMVGPMKFLIFSSAVIVLLQYYRNGNLRNVIEEARDYFFPWLFWFCGIIVLCVVHGTDGFSKYINFYLIMLAGIVAIPAGVLKREFVCSVASCSVLVLVILIALDYFWHGLSSGFLGVNKNTLLGGIMLLTSVSLSSLVFEEKEQNNITKGLAVSSFLLVCVCIYITEVRTALLGLIGIAIVIFFHTFSHNRKIFYIVMVGFVFAVVALVLSGRLGQGLTDIRLWLRGEPNTSWGIRLELWLLSIKAFSSKPIFGWGAQPFAEIVASGLSFPQSIGFVRHFHSDFFNMLCTGGLVGIASWLSTVCLILKKSWKDTSMVMLIVTILFIGLSERYWFDMQEVLFLFACLLILLYKSRKIQANVK